ncbi:MAG TPA: hypothetical protein VFZ37_07605 [Jiangellaceae bacterium]
MNDPFGYRITKDGRVLISRGGRMIMTVAGGRAMRLIAQLENAADDAEEQQALARITGNYRRGNERAGKLRGS